MLTIVRRYGCATKDEADYVQEIFVRVFQSLDKYDAQKGNFKPWLRSITVRTIINKQTRTRILLTVNIDDHSIQSDPNLQLDDCDIEYILEAIRQLPEGYRMVFNLYEIDGYSHQEIGEMLGITASASRSQLSRAKAILKKNLLVNYEISA